MSFSQRDYKGNDLLILDSVIGYRQWNWDNYRLQSMKPGSWTNGSLTAECHHFSVIDSPEKHRSPDLDCTCGIYAHYLPIESYERQNSNVFGVVEASGKILMGTKGFRAEKVKILALSSLGGCSPWFESKKPAVPEATRRVIDFCTSIGVPYFPTVEKMVHEFPQKDLSSLGVPDLSSWEENRDRDKAQFERREEEARKRLEEGRFLESQLFQQYGIVRDGEILLSEDQRKRFIDTFKHLGGYP